MACIPSMPESDLFLTLIISFSRLAQVYFKVFSTMHNILQEAKLE